MILLEMPLEGNDFNELTQRLPKDSYMIVEPKNIDGQAVIQVLLEIAKVTIPALVSFFVGRKSLSNITWKYKGKIDVEMTAAINKKELSEQKLAEYFYAQAEKIEGMTESRGDNDDRSDNS